MLQKKRLLLLTKLVNLHLKHVRTNHFVELRHICPHNIPGIIFQEKWSTCIYCALAQVTLCDVDDLL